MLLRDEKFVPFELGLSYDDVLMVPRYSNVSSRLSVDLSPTVLSPLIKLKYPIMSAAMDTVTNGEMASQLYEMGCFGIVHRFQSIEDRIGQTKLYPFASMGVAVGLQDSVDDCVKLAGSFDLIAVDVAHAHNEQVMEFVRKLDERISDPISIMVGNVATGAAALDMIDAGADVIKVGIGPGAACTTRIVTGFGVPNVTAIMNVKAAIEEHADGQIVPIVADGGIRNSGDAAKALAAGADYVMLGSLFSGTEEAPGEVVEFNGRRMKKFRGMASNDAQQDWKDGLKLGTVAEGVETMVPYKGTACNVVNDIVGGLRSSFTYAGATTMREFYDRTLFLKVTSNSLRESQPHILERKS